MDTQQPFLEADQSPALHHWTRKRQEEWQRQRDAARKLLNDYDPPEWGEAELDTLYIDAKYQRDRSESKVHALRAHFQPNACQPLAISLRANGRRYLVDGQHRAAVLRDIGLSTWPALIYRGLSLAQEAAMWKEINTRQTKPQPAYRFLASLQAKEAEACAVDAVVTGAGYLLNLRRRSQKKSGREIEAIEAVLRIYRRHLATGLAEVLQLIAAAWADDVPERTSRLVLLGVTAFRHGPWAPRVQEKRAADILGKYHPNKWVAKARGTDQPPDLQFSLAVKAAYNAGLRKPEKL
jgi:hypothetical protein